MKKRVLSLLCIFIATYSMAQTPVPYFTDFETTAQRAGWTQHSKGNVSTFQWFVGASGGTSTSPNVLVSPNAEFTSSDMTDTVIQWYVSPGFNFSTGGKVDSFSILVFQPEGNPQPSDSIVLYLLQGSPDPSLATSKVRLANLTRMAKGFGAAMKDTGNFVIPPTAGTSYLAFKYFSVYDWFRVYIDSIYISGNPHTQTSALQKGSNQISVFPNPANTIVNVVFDDNTLEGTELIIADAVGREVFRGAIPGGRKSVEFPVNDLPAGSYFVMVTTEGLAPILKKLELVR